MSLDRAELAAVPDFRWTATEQSSVAPGHLMRRKAEELAGNGARGTARSGTGISIGS